jgi:hypothetical protein
MDSTKVTVIGGVILMAIVTTMLYTLLYIVG